MCALIKGTRATYESQTVNMWMHSTRLREIPIKLEFKKKKKLSDLGGGCCLLVVVITYSPQEQMTGRK